MIKGKRGGWVAPMLPGPGVVWDSVGLGEVGLVDEMDCRRGIVLLPVSAWASSEGGCWCCCDSSVCCLTRKRIARVNLMENITEWNDVRHKVQRCTGGPLT
jgi:hypothetical protein